MKIKRQKFFLPDPGFSVRCIQYNPACEQPSKQDLTNPYTDSTLPDCTVRNNPYPAYRNTLSCLGGLDEPARLSALYPTDHCRQAACHTEERIVGDRPALRGIVLLRRRRHCTVRKRDFFVRSLFGQACPGSEGVRRSHHGR
jgi:hypothetical protein